MEYSETLLEHFRQPRNAGRFPGATPQLFQGTAGSRRLGREVRFELRLDRGRVVECRYQVYGCPATIALCSLLSERIRGSSAVDAEAFDVMALADELGLSPVKRAAALVLEDALRAALQSYNKQSVAEPMRA